MIEYIERKRRVFALIFGVLILIMVAFSFYLTYTINEINSSIKELERIDDFHLTEIEFLEQLKAHVDNILFYISVMIIVFSVISVVALHQVVLLGRNFKMDEIGKYYSIILLAKFLEKDKGLDDYMHEKIENAEDMEVKDLLLQLKKYAIDDDKDSS